MEIDSKYIERKLYFTYRSGSSVLVPNYHALDWYECDLYRITRAGYSYEYEIKVDLTDFRIDMRKSKVFYNPYRSERKHDWLRDGDPRAPNYFYYVVPKELSVKIQKYDLLPDWCGLLEIERYPVTIVKAPKIHRTKVSDEQRVHASASCLWRYWEHRLAA
jgi:hypothetical protein